MNVSLRYDANRIVAFVRTVNLLFQKVRIVS
jgi:hypothetical protein